MREIACANYLDRAPSPTAVSTRAANHRQRGACCDARRVDGQVSIRLAEAAQVVCAGPPGTVAGAAGYIDAGLDCRIPGAVAVLGDILRCAAVYYAGFEL